MQYPQTQLGFGPNYGSMAQFGMATPTVPGNTANINVPAPMQQPTGVVSTQGPVEGVTDPAAPGGQQQGWFGRIGGMKGVGTILDGIGDIGSIYASLKQLGIAREQLALSRDAYNTNLANQTQSYNTELEDRARARASATGASEAEINNYLKKHSL